MPVYTRKVRQGWRVCAENKDGFTDWPIQYSDGRIAYNHPYKFTKEEKAQVERTYKALRSSSSKAKWVLWSWTDPEDGRTFEDRSRFTVVRFCRQSWPVHGEYDETAGQLGYTRFIEDDTLIGGYFANSHGDCLLCLPQGSAPWDLVF